MVHAAVIFFQVCEDRRLNEKECLVVGHHSLGRGIAYAARSSGLFFMFQRVCCWLTIEPQSSRGSLGGRGGGG